MPLTRLVGFKAKVQKGNRVQIPRLIRWEFKLEPEQVLRVTVNLVDSYAKEEFFARMSRDGRLTIPKFIVDLLRREEELKSLLGYALEVELYPAEAKEQLEENNEEE